MEKRAWFIIMMAAIMLLAASDTTPASEGYNAGKSAGSTFNGYLNSPDKINTRVNQPLTSSSTPMKTFGPSGQQQSFNAQLTAPSSESFLDIFAQPGPAGDISTLTIKQDLDFDGSFDYAYDSPVVVSGICANGFISCNPGTWQNCSYYNWHAGNDLKISIQARSSVKGLAGCYCINSSCGSNLVWTNMEYVLTTLGGGIIGYIQDSDPHVVVTSVDSSLTYIKYYGQRTSDAGKNLSSSGVYFSGTANPESLFRTGDFSADDEMINQAADPNSPFSLTTTAYDVRMNPKEAKNCMIDRKIDFNASDQPYVVLKETCSSIDLAGCSLLQETICDYNGNYCVYSYKNETGTGLTPISNLVALNSPHGSTWSFDTNGSVITYSRTDVTPNQSGAVSSGTSVWWHIERQYMCQTGVVIDPSKGNDRSKSVADTAILQGSMLVYEDYGTQHNVQLTLGEDVVPCEKACKVSLQVTNTQVGTEGGTWEYNESVDTTETIYKTCVNDTCPLEAGETIVVGCTCQNDFAEAASIMQTMEQASKDIICSQD